MRLSLLSVLEISIKHYTLYNKLVLFIVVIKVCDNKCMFSYFQVSLGQANDLLSSDYDAADLPTGCHSVKGCGSIAPDPKDDLQM